MGRRVYRSLLGVVVGASLGAATPVSWATEVPDDRTQVAAVARDYLESWYTADSDRMGRALHPDMVKRYVDSLPAGRQVVHSLTRDLMVEMTRGAADRRSLPRAARSRLMCSKSRRHRSRPRVLV